MLALPPLARVLARSALRGSLVLALVLAAAPAMAAEADLATYRAFTLGASPAEVIANTTAVPADVKTVHERPSVLEQLAWRLPSRSAAVERESVSTIAFSFIDHQLYRMAIDYDAERTEGLTRADLIASLVAIYGPRSTGGLPPSPKPAYDTLDAVTPVAVWRQGETLMVLGHSTYRDGFSLIITSTRLEALARRAEAAAMTLDAREAPAREAAKAKADAEVRRAAEEKVRTTNKETFTP
jgi:hypothetical protein